MISKKTANSNNSKKSDYESCSVCQDLLKHMERVFDMFETNRRAPKSDWLTVEDIAGELKISKNVVYRIIRNGELESVNIVETNGHIAQRGHYRIKRSSLNKYLETKKTKPLSNKPIRISYSRHFPKVKNYLGL